MGKNIVICSDGTGNSFGRHVSNVASLVTLLALNDHRHQVVIYVQGIGTDSRRWKEIERFHRTVPDADALQVLRGPHETWLRPLERWRLLKGLAFGDGLEANVRQMYRTLAELYEADDLVFLFGFSRGAFAVRALAGLIYRCGLPCRGRAAEIDRLFERAWRLYQPLEPDRAAVVTFRETERQRDCPIQFLGLWDTVKSYGGLRPVMLPHLRHNPIVQTVRHALALDERRGWFDATTWGRLDLDKNPQGAMSRLSDEEARRVMNQDIEEIWFRGCHADVGGGGKDVESGRIALRWILGEANAASIELSDAGVALLESGEAERPEVHESRSLFWRLVERLPRNEIDNSGLWPYTKPACRPDAPRDPSKLTRNEMVAMHESARTASPGVRVVRTKRFQEASRQN